MEKIVKGYKATDKNMQCNGYQYTLGDWHEYEGDIEMCSRGFHFCEYPSGPCSFYPHIGARIFKVEAREVIYGNEPGATLKHVAKFIRLVEEINPTGDWNTGHSNTGDSNTGDSNTGDRNTGDSNTGDSNTGDRNTGDSNTGHRNTGDSNTGHSNIGHRNTGDWNTGHGNTGDWNTGHGNTGDSNTGHSNTGDSNVGNLHTGYFCKKPPKQLCFDKEFSGEINMEHVLELNKRLFYDTPFKITKSMLSLPNATKEKILSLHKEHIKARKIATI